MPWNVNLPGFCSHVCSELAADWVVWLAGTAPQLSVITVGVGTRCAAAYWASARSVIPSLKASTSSILQFGQSADTASKSSAISVRHPVLPCGRRHRQRLGVAPLVDFLKAMVRWCVQGGRLNVARYVARSDSAVELSYASTIAMVWFPPAIWASAARS